MHPYSIEDSGADSRTKKQPSAERARSAEALDPGGGRSGDQHGIAATDWIADVMSAVLRFDNNQDCGKLMFPAEGFGLGNALKFLGLARVFVPIDAVEVDASARISH
jgi:hypothetical protein